MYSRAVEGKTLENKQVILNIVKHFADVFSKDDTDLGCTHLAVHEIPTEDGTPVKQPPRLVPVTLAHEEKEFIDNLKKQGVIFESISPWASPIVLMRKKNGKIHPCVDYRRVNILTRKDAYPIPRTQDYLDSIGCFSNVLDARHDFWLLPDANQGRRHPQNSLHHQTGYVRVYNHAIRFDKCAGYIPAGNGNSLQRSSVVKMAHLPGGSSDIWQDARWTCHSVKTGALGHPQGWLKTQAGKMWIVPNWSQILRACRVSWGNATRSNKHP